MNRKSGIIAGVILILLGLVFLAREFFPDVFWFWDWPLIIVGTGLAFLISAILSGRGGLAIPGVILAGMGGILYYQSLNNAWTTWRYIWALIPGFVGAGLLLSGIINRRYRKAASSGLTLIFISAILFFAFGSAFGLRSEVVKYWPALLVVLGVMALALALASDRNK